MFRAKTWSGQIRKGEHTALTSPVPQGEQKVGQVAAPTKFRVTSGQQKSNMKSPLPSTIISQFHWNLSPCPDEPDTPANALAAPTADSYQAHRHACSREETEPWGPRCARPRLSTLTDAHIFLSRCWSLQGPPGRSTFQILNQCEAAATGRHGLSFRRAHFIG